MFLSAAQLEPTLLRRLESLGASGPGLGLSHVCRLVLQAHNSAAGLEWSSTDGQEDTQQDISKVDIHNAFISPHLEAWQAFVSGGSAVSKAQYFAAAHVLVQDILGTILSGNEVTITREPLAAAWQEDSGGSDALPTDQFELSLATLLTACSSDGTAQTAAAGLSSLLAKLQGQSERWQGLVTGYASDAGGQAAAAADDDDDDLDALLDGDDEKPSQSDVAPASDKGADRSAASYMGDAASDIVRTGASDDEGDDDGASSLGLSRAASQASLASGGEAEGADDAAPVNRHVSTKSIIGPELRRQISRSLSGASSADLDALPNDLDALEQRQESHGAASTKAPKPRLLAGMMATEEGKGHLAEMPMDLRSWAQFKDKTAAPHPGATVGRGRNDVGGSLAIGKQAPDQHLKGARAGAASIPANPLHKAIISGSAARQSAERERGGTVHGIVGPGGMARNGSNESPLRQRSLVGPYGSSRKLSVSEPGPTGPQAEWKHLPALGQASKLHPHELRQPSRTALSRGTSVSPSASAAALIDDKLPILPALMGARGAPPKAMELMRRPSQGPRSDAHRADSRQPPPNAHLPGLGAMKGAPMPPVRATLRLPSKKSYTDF